LLGLASRRRRGFAEPITPRTESLLIVTPTVGVSPWLAETVAGVATLAVARRHVLVSPETAVQALKARFPHTLVVPEAANGGGMYAAINAGSNVVVDWDWLTWINDDDCLRPGFGELWRRAQAAPAAADVWYGEVDYVGPEGGKLAAMPVCRRPADVPALLASGLAPFTQQGALISRDLWRRLGGMDASLRIAGDFDFWIRAAASGARFRFVPGTVAAYRMRPGQLSGGVTRARQEEEAVLRRCDLAVGRARRWMASVRFRAENLPRIIQRAWRTGRLRSRQMYAR